MNVGPPCPCLHPSSILFPLFLPSFKKEPYFSDCHHPRVYFLLSFCVCTTTSEINILTTPAFLVYQRLEVEYMIPHDPQKTANSFSMAGSYRLTKHFHVHHSTEFTHPHESWQTEQLENWSNWTSRTAQPALINPLPWIAFLPAPSCWNFSQVTAPGIQHADGARSTVGHLPSCSRWAVVGDTDSLGIIQRAQCVCEGSKKDRARELPPQSLAWDIWYSIPWSSGALATHREGSFGFRHALHPGERTMEDGG
jgi:hypothetical protein